MTLATTRPTTTFGGLGLLGLGVGLVALALVLLLATRGGGSSSPAAVVDPARATSATIAFWEERAHADPADFTALNRLASAYIQRGRETGEVAYYSSAEAAVQASLAELPGDNYTAYALEAYLQNVRHDFAASIETARQASAIDPADSFAPLIIVDNQFALGEYDAAFESANILVRRTPGLSTFSRLAQLYEIRGDLRNAEGAWQNAIELDSGTNAESTAWAHTQYGHFLFNQGRLDDAGHQYTGSLAAFPGYIHALAGQANIAAARGHYDRAIELYTQVTESQPQPQYVAALGDVYAAAGQAGPASKQYSLFDAIQQLYRASGINTDLQASLFYADHDTNLSEALQGALAAREDLPGSVYAADALAWALYKAGRPNEAMPYAKQALAQGTQDASFFYHAGLIHMAVGDYDAARTELHKALDINPHFAVLQAQVAQQALEELR